MLPGHQHDHEEHRDQGQGIEPTGVRRQLGGHGIGLHLHEDPYLGRYHDYTLEAGMVLGIEPLVYRTGMGFGGPVPWSNGLEMVISRMVPMRPLRTYSQAMRK